MELPLLVSVGVGVMLMIATLAALMLMVLGRCEAGDLGALVLMLTPTTCALVAAVAWRSVHPPVGGDDVTRSCLYGATFAGGANIPLTVLLAGLITSTDLGKLVEGVAFATVAGPILGAPLGFAFGVASLGPIRFTASLPPGLDVYEQVAQVSWRWLSAVGAFCALLVGVGLQGAVGLHDGAAALFIVAFVISGAALLAAQAASRRLAARRRWLERVAAGAVPGWAVVPLEELSAEGFEELSTEGLETLPLYRATLARELADAVIGRWVPTSDPGGAYRSGERLEPVALVARAGADDAGEHLGRRSHGPRS